MIIFYQVKSAVPTRLLKNALSVEIGTLKNFHCVCKIINFLNMCFDILRKKFQEIYLYLHNIIFTNL